MTSSLGLPQLPVRQWDQPSVEADSYCKKCLEDGLILSVFAGSENTLASGFFLLHGREGLSFGVSKRITLATFLCSTVAASANCCIRSDCLVFGMKSAGGCVRVSIE